MSKRSSMTSLTRWVLAHRRLVLGLWLVVAVAFMLAVVTAVAVELAGRPQLHLAPLVAVIAGFTGAMAISAPVHPTLATSVALGLLVGFARREPEAAAALRQRRRSRSAGLSAGRVPKQGL